MIRALHDGEVRIVACPDERSGRDEAEVRIEREERERGAKEEKRQMSRTMQRGRVSGGEDEDRARRLRWMGKRER